MTIFFFTVIGNPVFDYFFCLVFWIGIISFGPSAFVRLFKW